MCFHCVVVAFLSLTSFNDKFFVGSPNSFNFMQFWEKIGQIIAYFRVGAPSSGKSWIRHCSVKTFRKTSIVKVENTVHSRFRCLTSLLNYLPESSISYCFHCMVSPKRGNCSFPHISGRSRKRFVLLCSPLFHISAGKIRKKRNIVSGVPAMNHSVTT